MAFVKDKVKYDIEGLLRREGIYEKIIELSSYKDFTDIKWNFNNLVNSIYTCIKSARQENFKEDFWTDWKDK